MKAALVLVLGFISMVVVGVVLLLGWVFWRMSVNKGEIELDARYEAQFNVVETKLFEMRSAVKNIHKCSDEWADKFIKVVAMQASGRGGNRAVLPEGNGGVVAGAAVAASGTTLQIGRESEALGIPQELYMKLANAIEGKMADFTRQQDVLSDIWRSHTAYCRDPYHNWLGTDLAGKVKPKPEMITSSETKEAVKTKKMAEDLF